MSKELLVLDSPEIAVDRAALNLNSGAIRVREEGPDWGDHEITAYMAQAAKGDLPVDFRVPNRHVTIPLYLLDASDDGGLTFAAAQAAIQQKVGTFQREGGILKRETRDGRRLYLDIVNATLSMGGSTAQALDDFDMAVNLTLEAIPDFYEDEDQVTLSASSETSLSQLTATMEDVGGDWPARMRAVLTDLQGVDQLGGILAFRARHYDSAATAKLDYEAEALTPLDTAAIATVTGASGGGTNNVVAHTNLPAGSFAGVVSTQILSGGADLTHVGTYQWLARVRSPDGNKVQVRGVYDVGDFVFPEQNDAWTVPAANQFFIADLGTVRLDKVPVGDHRWKGAIQAKGTVGGEDIQVDWMEFIPLDESATQAVAVLTSDTSLATFAARDDFNQTAGALAGKAAALGGNWSGAGDTDDFNVDATGHTAQRTAVSDANVNTGRYEVVGSALTNMSVSAKMRSTAAGAVLGVIARYVDVNNWLMYRATVVTPGSTTFDVVKRVAGTVTTYSSSLSASFLPNTDRTLAISIDAAGNFLPSVDGTPLPVVGGNFPELATGGVLASGKAGIYDARTSATAATRTFDSFVVSASPSDAVVYASQSAEFRTDGLFREDSAGIAFGPVTRPTDMLPRLPVSGYEGRTIEVIAKLTRGDFASLPDGGIDDIGLEIYARRSWMFVGSA